jgi:hypothetical protein
MVQQTIKLFIKAVVVGVLLNVGIQLVPNEPVRTEENISHEQEPLQQPSSDTIVGFLNQIDG